MRLFHGTHLRGIVVEIVFGALPTPGYLQLEIFLTRHKLGETIQEYFLIIKKLEHELSYARTTNIKGFLTSIQLRREFRLSFQRIPPKGVTFNYTGVNV